MGERQQDMQEGFRRLIDNLNGQLRVAMPGIIKAFDPSEQTVTVLCAVRERVIGLTKNIEYIEIPYLLDVPVVMPRAGGFSITFPIQVGDECLVIFSDVCIDAWWADGDVQNPIEYRRHDFSDAFAILGPWSQPRVLTNYSTTDLEIRNDAKTSMIKISNTEINIISPTVKVNGVPI